MLGEGAAFDDGVASESVGSGRCDVRFGRAGRFVGGADGFVDANGMGGDGTLLSGFPIALFPAPFCVSTGPSNGLWLRRGGGGKGAFRELSAG